MALKKHPMLMVLFIVVGIMAALAPIGLSQLEPAPAAFVELLLQTPGPFPDIPLPGLLPGQSGSEQCWLSLINIKGCSIELMNALQKGQSAKIGTACCHAILSIDDNCWALMFPLQPLFPPFLKQLCDGPDHAHAPTMF